MGRPCFVALLLSLVAHLACGGGERVTPASPPAPAPNAFTAGGDAGAASANDDGGAAAADESGATGAHEGCSSEDVVDRAILDRPTTIKTGIGRVTQKVSTSSSEAQAFYDQGLTFLHSYVFIEAARSFHQSLRSDPNLAMAWLGVARAELNLSQKREARDALAKAKELSASASEKEKRYIALFEAQLAAIDAPSKHAAYKRAIEDAIAQDPPDAELWIMRGNAEEPGAWGRGQLGGVGAIAFYEAALARSAGHAGAHHYLVHAYENIARYPSAAEHAKIYAAAAPRVAHAQHMYGHVLPRIGKWQQALEQFEKADAIETAYADAEKLRPGDDWHHVHNLTLLGYAYVRLNRVADAEKTFRRAFAVPLRGPKQATSHVALPEFLLLRGRWDEALTAARSISEAGGVARAVGRVLEAEALIGMGRVDDARAAIKDATEALPPAPREGAPPDRAHTYVTNAIKQTNGELDLRGDEWQPAANALTAIADAAVAGANFDSWGPSFFRLERIANFATRVKRDPVARAMEERMKKIDPQYVFGSASGAAGKWI